jgi:hypothetical protein
MKIDYSLSLFNPHFSPPTIDNSNLLKEYSHTFSDFKRSTESTFDAQRSTDDWSSYRERAPCNNVARLIWIDRIHVCLE